MKHHSVCAMLVVLGVALAGPAALAVSPSTSTDPGFNARTGQINPGHDPAPWSTTPALPQDQQPSQKDARAALMMPDEAGMPSPGGTPPQGGGRPVTGPGTSVPAGPAPVASPAQSAPPAATAQAQPAPIGATMQTMPAKYSHRNDLLDHVPLAAWPFLLTPQQRQQIYQAVMAQNAQPVAGIDKLKPASALSSAQVRDLRPLPPQVATIDGLQGLKYLRGKDKVLLIRPSTRIVVDQITM